MKILIKKDVISQGGWRKEGEIHDLDDKLGRHYIQKGIGVAYETPVVKEEKATKETKEAKAPRKRTTKKSK